MRYTGEEAIGLIETLGMVPALEAADKMFKAGVEAASAIGKVTAQNVMKRPVPPIGDVVSVTKSRQVYSVTYSPFLHIYG